MNHLRIVQQRRKPSVVNATSMPGCLHHPNPTPGQKNLHLRVKSGQLCVPQRPAQCKRMRTRSGLKQGGMPRTPNADSFADFRCRSQSCRTRSFSRDATDPFKRTLTRALRGILKGTSLKEAQYIHNNPLHWTPNPKRLNP